MNQDELIKLFVEHLSKVNDQRIEVVSRPDKLNRKTKDIDALAKASNKFYAIEHTSIDTLPEQRKHDDWYNKVFGNLEKELAGKFDGNIHISTLFGSIKPGISWENLSANIKKWLLKNIDKLPYGHGYHSISDVPFDLHINKKKSNSSKLYIGRIAPNDETLKERVLDRIQEKIIKYKKYYNSCNSILLIENSDIALMDIDHLVEIIRGIIQENTIEFVNEIWVADTSIIENIEFIKA